MLAASGFAACGGRPDAGTGPSAISLFLNPDSGSVQQSGSTLVQATVTRSGEFTGPVTFRVTGMPSGASAAVSIPQTSGSVTSAGLTISADATTAPGTYQLVIHGTGGGVAESSAGFRLGVTALPSSYFVSLSTTAISIPQGGSAPVTITIARVNFDAPVAMVIAGLPDKVSATFAPQTTTGTSAVLTLGVGADAIPGLYHLVVAGTAPGGPQSTPLRLTIVGP
jgi:hypothetical protein